MTIPRTLVARFTARDGRDADVRALLAEFERQVNTDPGTLTFRAFHDENSRGFTVWEQYKSDAAFQAHVTASHVVRFNELLTPLIEEDASVLTFMAPLTSRR